MNHEEHIGALEWHDPRTFPELFWRTTEPRNLGFLSKKAYEEHHRLEDTEPYKTLQGQLTRHLNPFKETRSQSHRGTRTTIELIPPTTGCLTFDFLLVGT